MSNPTLGSNAPNFNLADQTGKRYVLQELLEKQPVVLVFYPHDQTPLCTLQLRQITKSVKQLDDCHVTILGINNADQASHSLFASKRNIQLPLLCDTDFSVCKSFNALFNIGPFKIIRRTVIGINQDGTISYYQHGIPAIKEILSYVGSCRNPAPQT